MTLNNDIVKILTTAENKLKDAFAEIDRIALDRKSVV